MLVLIIIFFCLYLAIVFAVSAVLKAVKPGYEGTGIIGGALVACGVTLVLVFAAFAVFESDEPYWWYGPDYRMGILLMSTGVTISAALILGPVFGVRRHRKQKRKMGEHTPAVDR